MHVDDIAAMSQLVLDVCADDAVLALWVPNSLLSYGLRVVDQWGFTQKQVITWVKTTKDNKKFAFGMGRYFRNCSESCLLATRGRPKILNHSIRNVFTSPALSHSTKPEVLQDMLEKLFEGEYLELFARRVRPKWVTAGNECPTTLGEDIRDSLKRLAT
jgi:N6-adenosine-specific RNA methylase IME4